MWADACNWDEVARCSKCMKYRPHDDFYGDNLRGLDRYCKPCRRIMYKVSQTKLAYMRKYRAEHREEIMRKNAEWYKRNPHKQAIYARKIHYGLSDQEYQRMYKEQNGLCAIGCGRKIRDVDHDHKTGKARKLLCGFCNRSIGCFNDDPKLLRAAANYLESFGG